MWHDVISVAPMLDYTDRHFRFLMRLITRKTQLYTEMLTTKEILEDKTGRILELNPIEHPVAIQLGGSDPGLLAECARLAADTHYDEINLNVGCPSERVQAGRIGACLMLEPHLVAECVVAMQSASDKPITVKCRLGIDHHDSYDHLCNFIHIVAAVGCEKFIIHARKAWLKGLSPKQNREIPPLDYDMAYRLKSDFPQLKIFLNGGIKCLDEGEGHLNHLDGIMLGRAVYSNPYLLAEADRRFYGSDRYLSEMEVVLGYMEYVECELARGTGLTGMTRHLLRMFHNKPGARYWRKYLSCQGTKKGAGAKIIKEALHYAVRAIA